MVGFQAEYADVQENYPEVVEEYMNNLRNSNFSKYSDIDIEKIEWFYSYGFFLKKPKNEEERIERDKKIMEEVPLMLFDERLEYELSKVRVDVTMKAKNFIRSDRATSGVIPNKVREIVTEVTKVKMMVEQDYYGYSNVKESIPELDGSIISIEEIKDYISGDEMPQENLDVDAILDKINDGGMESLTDEEKEYLKRQSEGDN